MKTHKEKIICPNCGAKQWANVEHTLPWAWNYTHKCIKCGYWITESEWEVSDAKKEAGCLVIILAIVIIALIVIINI
jgi:predicted RNA-binding Zn-ribbon protein involved in translation (DUF1610 family)